MTKPYGATMKLKMTGLAVALALVAGQASAADWVMTDFNTGVVTFMDFSSKLSANGKQRAWFKMVYSPVAKTSYDEAMSYIEFGCAEREIRLLQVRTYKDGVKVSSNDRPALTASVVVPDTPSESILASVCRPDLTSMFRLAKDKTPRELADSLFDGLNDEIAKKEAAKKNP